MSFVLLVAYCDLIFPILVTISIVDGLFAYVNTLSDFLFVSAWRFVAATVGSATRRLHLSLARGVAALPPGRSANVSTACSSRTTRKHPFN